MMARINESPEPWARSALEETAASPDQRVKSEVLDRVDQFHSLCRRLTGHTGAAGFALIAGHGNTSR